MKITTLASRQSAIQSVVEMCRDAAETSKSDAYSTTLELSIAELVRSRMRSLAADGGMWRRKDDLLHQAARETREELDAALAEREIKYDVDHFIHRAEKNLKYPGHELQELGSKLTESKSQQRVALPMAGTTDEGRSYVIHRLGLEGSTTGLLVKPFGNEVSELDFDRLHQNIPCDISGDYFPIEVRIDETIFVIDDDASIFCSVENLPQRMVQELESTICHIADSIYG